MKKVKLIISLLLTLSVVLLGGGFQAYAAEPIVTQLPPLGLNSSARIQPNGELLIYLFEGNQWREAGSLSFDEFLRQKELNLASLLPGINPVRIKLVKNGGGSAHLDAVLLGDRPPVLVHGEDGETIEKLSSKDNDLINFATSGVELSFLPGEEDKTLTVAARIESETISQIPYQFPLVNTNHQMSVNSAFYTYKLNSNKASLELGKMLETVSDRKPFFQEYIVPGSGHPPGIIYGWVMNDDKNLYVAQEFTPDNTMDGDKDYAKVYVKTSQGLKEFKVSLPETQWGQAYFIYTDKVGYQHKFYEFVIPLDQLGLETSSIGGDLEIAFAGYGTMSYVPGDAYPALAYNSVKNEYLLVYTHCDNVLQQVYGQRLSQKGEPVAAAFEITRGFLPSDIPSVSCDPETGKYLVTWVAHESSLYKVFGQLIDADGNLLEKITISSSTYAKYYSISACDSAHGRFLVAWADTTVGWQVYGRLVNVNGIEYEGSEFRIANKYYSNASVAFSTQTGKFLVVWDAYNSANTDVYGQVVNAEGILEGSKFVVSDSPAIQELGPSIKYDNVNNKFLVTWTDYRNVNNDIYGQILSANGVPVGTGFQVSDNYGDQYKSVIATDSNAGRFLVAWLDNSGVSYDVYGQLVDADGILVGENFMINDSEGYQHNPTLAFNPANGGFLAAFGTGSWSNMDIGLTLIIGDDLIPPTVTGTSSANNTINLTFSENIQVGPNIGGISIISGADTVVEYTYVILEREIILTPVAGLAPGTTYTVTLPAGAVMDQAVNNLASPYTFSFSTSQVVYFADENLEAAVRIALSKPSGSITLTDMAALTTLNAANATIRSLKGLEYAINLQRLYLWNNIISDLRPLKYLVNLKDLWLQGNQISDLSPLANLIGLRWLYLNNNQITYFESLDGLNNLEALYLNDNWISTIPVLNMPKLQVLHLDYNDMISISSLAGLLNLRTLGLNGNQISDLTPLNNLTGLRELFLGANKISDISPLAGLTNLKRLSLWQYDWSDYETYLVDLTPLEELINLEELWLSHNRINSLSSLVANSRKGGLGQGDYLSLEWNLLDFSLGSQAELDYQILINAGVTIRK